ncbi:MAG TPA: helix-turn-helix transcriptional regulator [Gammaproteobacteria bacterium]|nr:helix-turn-helix transcriptional regulator [Gammaproteobacteria bacterium]
MDSHKTPLIGEFLKSCRARTSPGELGLPEADRRRTPGLRREDVAALAGVSVTWYTWLEQGRDIQVSAAVLERISATLRLSFDEREYLFGLVQHRPAPLLEWRNAEVSSSLHRMINRLRLPALAMTARWDVVAWNSLVCKVLRDYEKIPGGRRNLLRILLVEDELYRKDSEIYEAMAHRVLAKFRVDYSTYSGEPEFEELIDDLNEHSEAFRRLWNSPEVMGRSEGIVRHPQLGGITLEHTSYVPEGCPALRVVIYAPYDEESAAKIDALDRDEGPAPAGSGSKAAPAGGARRLRSAYTR